MSQLEGTVKTWKPDRGFGFIKVDTNDPDVFFHKSEVIEGTGEPQIGCRASFTTVVDGVRGTIKANNIYLFSESEKRKADNEAESPDAKRLKPFEAPPEVLRKQVEYYISDQNLKNDKFFYEKIGADAEGWLDLKLILECNKMKAMKATQELVLEALQNSSVEVRVTNCSAAVRRPGNKVLPEAEWLQREKDRDHLGGVVLRVENIPSRGKRKWVHARTIIEKVLPKQSRVDTAIYVAEQDLAVLWVTPFEGHLQKLDGIPLNYTHDKLVLHTKIPYGDLLQQTLVLLPQKTQDRRAKLAKKYGREVRALRRLGGNATIFDIMEEGLPGEEVEDQVESGRRISLADREFPDISTLRGFVQTILNARARGEVLNKQGADYQLVHALLMSHPEAKEKMEGMTDIKVGRSEQGNANEFFIVKGAKAEECHYIECLEAIEKAQSAKVLQEPLTEGSSTGTTPPSEATATPMSLFEPRVAYDGQQLGKKANTICMWGANCVTPDPKGVGGFALASFMLGLIGLKKICSFHKPRWALQEPLICM